MRDFPGNKIRTELASVANWLDANSIKYSILQSAYEFEAVLESMAVTDVDIYVQHDFIIGFCDHLDRSGWSEIESYRFRRIRRFYSKFVDGFKLKLDISSECSLFVGNYEYRYKPTISFFEKKDGLTFLKSIPASQFILMKAEIYQSDLSDSKKRVIKELTKYNQSFCYVSGSNVNGVGVKKYFYAPQRHNVSLLKVFSCYASRFFLSESKECISFVGMDGAGKGTYIEMLQADLAGSNIAYKTIYLGHSSYETNVMKYVARKKDFDARLKITKNIYRLLYLMLFPFELLFRRGRGRYEVIITDRHPVVEPVLGTKFLSLYDQLLLRVAPKPTKIFYLSGRDNVLWARKKEMPHREFVQKSKMLRAMVENIKNKYEVVEFNTEESADIAYSGIWNEIKNGL